MRALGIIICTYTPAMHQRVDMLLKLGMAIFEVFIPHISTNTQITHNQELTTREAQTSE